MSDTRDLEGGLRARRRATTERDIENAALAAFETHGFDSTTMDQVAAGAGVSVRTAFRYFPAKVDTVLFSARRVQAVFGDGLRSDIHQNALLSEVEDSIAKSLTELMKSDPALIARLRRVRALMLQDERLRAEVAKSDGFRATIELGNPTTEDQALRTSLVLGITAATLSSAFDTWASGSGDGDDLVGVYERGRAVRDSLLR
jgi:AcrR family transcriptional regulator